MKFVLQIAVLSIFVGLIAGCSKEGPKPDTFSNADMCIVKIGEEKTKLCYGDTRADVEKTLGAGKENAFGFMYDFGVSVIYRGEIAAGITLNEESKGVFKTSRGAQIGMLKSEITALYGTKYAIDNTANDSVYYYDTKNKKFLGKVSLENVDASNASPEIQVLSTNFDSDGYLKSIMLIDQKMAVSYS